MEDVEAGALPNENAPWLPLPEPAPESLGPPPNPDPNGNMAQIKGSNLKSREMNANAKGNCSRRLSDPVLHKTRSKEREKTMAERKSSGKYFLFFKRGRRSLVVGKTISRILRHDAVVEECPVFLVHKRARVVQWLRRLSQLLQHSTAELLLEVSAEQHQRQ